jgi:uncharacterized protein YcfJ
MKKKSSPQIPKNDLPISRQTAGGVAGAVVGSAVAGPVGAVVGAIAGTIMGNRSAQGKPLVSSGTVTSVKKAAKAASKKVPALKSKLTTKVVKPAKAMIRAAKAKAPVGKAAKASPAKKAPVAKKPAAKKRK